MADEPHEVVKLLVARMESHPEEFERGTYRWANTISDITEWGNETDKAAIDAKLRDIRLGEAHEDMMDELCNGPERRRMQQEEAEYERQMLVKQAMVQQQMAAQKYAQQYGNAFPQSLGTAGTWLEEGTTGSKGLLTDTITQISQMIRNKK